MKNQYYLKDKKAQIFKKVLGEKDSNGFLAPSAYYPRASFPLWCYSKQLTQEQIFAAMTYGQKETRLFVFNYFSGINVYNLILYRDTWYEITRVDTTDDYKGDLFLYAAYCNIQEVPDSAQIMSYTDGIW